MEAFSERLDSVRLHNLELVLWQINETTNSELISAVTVENEAINLSEKVPRSLGSFSHWRLISLQELTSCWPLECRHFHTGFTFSDLAVMWHKKLSHVALAQWNSDTQETISSNYCCSWWSYKLLSHWVHLVFHRIAGTPVENFFFTYFCTEHLYLS